MFIFSPLKKMFSTIPLIKKITLNRLGRIAPIKISESASNQLTSLINCHPDMEQIKGIRLGVKKQGCNGLTYTLNFIKKTIDDCKKVKNDDVILCNNTSIFIDPKAVLSIIGTTMDYTDNDITSEFTFINPNSKGSCGCGESFIT